MQTHYLLRQFKKLFSFWFILQVIALLPYVISNAETKKTSDCFLVKVKSLYKANDKWGYQLGTGSVIEFHEQNQASGKQLILTAAHVVANSDKIMATCNGLDPFELKIHAIDYNRDVAFLEPLYKILNLKTFFIISDSKESAHGVAEDLNANELMIANDFFRLFDFKSLKENWRNSIWPKDFLPQTAPHESFYILNKLAPAPQKVSQMLYATNPILSVEQPLQVNLGLRPGMSGSPLFYKDDQSSSGSSYRLLGIASKTLKYETESLFIP
ncbi:MAG: hypothetical protein ACOYOK_05685, partial [Pseudobdellovibrionaceae bacterium]